MESSIVGNSSALGTKHELSPSPIAFNEHAQEEQSPPANREKIVTFAAPETASEESATKAALTAFYIKGIQRPIEGVVQLAGNGALESLHQLLPHLEGEPESTKNKIAAGIGDVLGESIPIGLAALIARRIAPHVVAEEAAAGKVVGEKLEAFAQRMNRNAALKRGIPPEIGILLNPGGPGNHSKIAGALSAVGKGLQTPLSPRGGWLRFATHEAPMTGFIAESLFQPAPEDEKHIALWRLGAGGKGAALATLQFGATAGLMKFVPRVSTLRMLPGGETQKIIEGSSALTGGGVGFLYGAVSAQADSLYNKHEFASVKDTLTSAGSRAIVGTTLGLGYDYRYSLSNIKYKIPELDFSIK